MKYIVDTNILLQQPEVMEQYDTIITSHVLREIEELELKRRSDRQLQWEIRRAKRYMDDHEHGTYDLKDYKFSLTDELDAQYVDNILLQVAIDNGYGLITNDKLLREKSRLYNIEVVDVNDNTYIEHKGFKEVSLSETQLDNIMDVPNVNSFELITNEYVIANNVKDGELLDIIKWDGKVLRSLRDEKGRLDLGVKSLHFGELKPKDEQQIMAIDSILTNQVTQIRGRAGSGKSLIALSTAWHLVEKEGYKLVIFVNPVPSLNAQELGFYKGDKLEKLLQSSVGTMLKSKFGDEDEILQQIQLGKLDILPFVDLRGFDTGDKTIAWVLESQNLTTELMKLGMQRIGEGSKVIVDGDYHQQIDKSIYQSDNGMKRLSEVFRGIDLYGEVELQNVWRSRIAEIADSM